MSQFQKHIYGNLGRGEVEDIVDVISFLELNSGQFAFQIDAENITLYGWSYGKRFLEYISIILKVAI